MASKPCPSPGWWSKEVKDLGWRQVHLDLLTQLQAKLPENCRVVFIGDGLPFSFADLCLQIDDPICISQVWFTRKGYGPVTVIAACLAYLWIVYLGCIAVRNVWVRIIHRPDRCDWS